MRTRSFFPTQRMSLTGARITPLLIGILLLATACVLHGTTIFVNHFSDEADKLAGGALITRGSVLYRDLFTHHFPLTYYLAAAGFQVFGNTVLAGRLVVLVLNLLAYGIVMRYTRWYVGVGMGALAWAAVAPFFYGNLLLYNGVAGSVLVPVVLLTLAVTTKDIAWTPMLSLVIGGCAALALLADPMSALPVAVALIALFLATWQWRAPLFAAGVIAAILCACVAALAAAGALQAAYTDVVRFNLDVYSNYTPIAANRLYELVHQVLHVYYVYDAPRFARPDLFTLYGNDPTGLASPLLNGQLFRILVLLMVGMLLLQRRWLAAATLFLIGATLLLRADVHVRLIPFVMLACLLLGMIAARIWHASPAPHSVHQRLTLLCTRGAQGAALLACGLLIWLSLANIAGNTNRLSYWSNFKLIEQRAMQFTRRSCNLPVALVAYPGETYIYFFSGLRPASRYIYFWPWVADVGTNDVITAIQTERYVIVALDLDGSVWGRPKSTFLAPIDTAARSRLIAEPRMLRSPELVERCPMR